MTQNKSIERSCLGAALSLIATLSLPGVAAADVVDELQPGHWAAVSLNTLRDVDPCPGGGCSYSAVEGQAAVLDDWNVGAFATRTELAVATSSLVADTMATSVTKFTSSVWIL